MPSLYEITIPVFIVQLNILSGLLDKGLAHTGGDEAPLMESRLIADMHPLAYQIQRVSDTVKGFAVRVGGATPVAWADDEKTIAELKARLAQTIAFLEALDPATFEGKDDVEVILATRAGEQKFTGKSYVLRFALPNFYFHFVTAYGLLRKEGVPIGKKDYLRGE